MRCSGESRSRLWSILIGSGFLLKSYKTRGKANMVQATEHVGQQGKKSLYTHPEVKGMPKGSKSNCLSGCQGNSVISNVRLLKLFRL